MDLAELKSKVDRAVEHAKECGEDPKEIRVSVQVDGPGDGYTFSEDVELHYDNHGNASGCVICGYAS